MRRKWLPLTLGLLHCSTSRERVISLLYSWIGDQQDHLLQDYIEYSLMLYNLSTDNFSEGSSESMKEAQVIRVLGRQPHESNYLFTTA